MPGRNIALLIGNGAFAPGSGFASLRCPANDVRAMAAMLQDKTHADFEVTALVDRPQNEITKAIYNVLNTGAGFDDTVLIYYSGHGCPDDDGSLFLAASDSVKAELPITAVATDFLCNRMRAAKSQKIFLILDCCFSGSIAKAFTKGEVSEQVKSVLPKQFSGTGSYVLTASTDTQLAEEKESDQNSLLTKHILSGILEGTADNNDDGIVTIHELVVHVQQTVPQEGAQRPWNFELRAGGGEMMFARTGLSNQAAKAKEVEEAVWKARDQYHVPLKMAQCIWSMVSDDELKRSGEPGRRRLNKLHSLVGDPSAFVAEIYELAEAVQRSSTIDTHEKLGAVPQTPAPQPPATQPDRPTPVSIPHPVAQPPRQFASAQAAFIPAPAVRSGRKWSPLVITMCVIAGLIGLLFCGAIIAGIIKALNDGPDHATASTPATSAMQPQASGIIFNYSGDMCSGTIYQVDATHWINNLSGGCNGTNGTVFEVQRTDTHVVLKGLNSPNYASLPLGGGVVNISSTGPNGPWVPWGYVQRADTHGNAKASSPAKE